MPNYLSNAMGAGASQDAEQAKAALLAHAMQQAGFRNGNEQAAQRQSKEAALAALGLQKYQGDSQRQMQEHLAAQAQGLEREKMTQQNAQFGQGLAANKENLGLKLGSEEKIAAGSQAIQSRLADIEGSYKEALATNDTTRADALAAEHAALTEQIKGQTQRSQEEFQYGPQALERSIFKDVLNPQSPHAGAGAVGPAGDHAQRPPDSFYQSAADNLPASSDFKVQTLPGDNGYVDQNAYIGPRKDANGPTADAGVHGDPGINTLGGVDRSKLDLLRMLKTGETPEDNKYKADKRAIELTNAGLQSKILANEAEGILSPSKKREMQRQAEGEATNQYAGITQDATINKTQAADRVAEIINRKFGQDITPLTKDFFTGAGQQPLLSTSPQAIDQAVAAGGRFKTADEMRTFAENEVGSQANQDVPVWKRLGGMAMFGPRIAASLVGSNALTPYLPTGVQSGTDQGRYLRKYIAEHPELDQKLRQKLRSMIALPQAQGDAFMQQTSNY